MKLTTALITLALALAGIASAVDVTSSTQSSSIALSSSTANASATINTQAFTVTGPHSVFGYIKYNSGQTTYGYSYFSQFNTSTPNAATTVASANAGTNQFQNGTLLCPVCIPAANITDTNGVYTYNYIYNPVTAASTLTGGQTVTVSVNATGIADTNVQLVNASVTALSLNTPSTDNLNIQPGKLLYVNIPVNPSAVGNVTTATFTFAASTTPNVNPFTDFYLIGAGKCPSDSTNTGRFHQSLASFTTLTGTVTVPGLTIGSYWIYLAPSATTSNTLSSGDTLALSLSAFNFDTCVADPNTGFCILPVTAPAASQSASAILTAGSPNGTITITDQAINVPYLHSVFGYIKYNSGQTTYGYNYYSQFNGTAPAALTTVSAANANTAQYQVGTLLCPVCIPAANITNTSGVYSYTYKYTPLSAAATLVSAQTITVTANATTITDSNVQLINASANPLSLRTPAGDNLNQQPGKLLYFTVNANPSAAGNIATATFTFAATTTGVNPFTDFYLVGAGKCPSDSTNTGRFHQSLASLTTLTGTVTVPNITVGTYWVYLAPSATANTLGASDTLALTLSQFSTGSCTADANGFCSGAATLKSVVGVAFAGVMAAAFMLF